MEDVLKHDSKWKYYINLASQMFPLKTNAEIVKDLTALKGRNDIRGELATDSPQWVRRYKYKVRYVQEKDGKDWSHNLMEYVHIW